MQRLVAVMFAGVLMLAAVWAGDANAAEGAIVLTVTPEDAEIWLDGKQKASGSPAYLKVEEGRHRVEVRKSGYDPQSFDELVAAGGVLNRKVQLVLASTGRITLTVTAGEAQIWLDGKFVNYSSSVVLEASGGRHHVEVRKTGYKTEILDLYFTVGTLQSRVVSLTRTPPTMAEWLDPPKPIKDAFETAEEFATRERAFERRKMELLREFNGFVGRPEFAAGTVTLDKNQYDIDTGRWPIKVTLAPWMEKRVWLKGWEAWAILSRDHARTLFAAGSMQPVYVTFTDASEPDKWFLVIGGEQFQIFWRNSEQELLRNMPLPKMILIPSGTFMMGGNEYNIEKPVHRVSIEKALELSATPITFDEWDFCVTDGGCDGYRPDDKGWGRGARPVINVSWDDAQSYLKWLNAKTGKTYRLPTEAEWEYAARAGTTTEYWWGDEVGKNNANCNGCGSQWDMKQTAPVASFKPNPFGLYDMNGNVYQWVGDCWHDNYISAPADGSVWSSEGCRMRILRGGSSFLSPGTLRSASRYLAPPHGRAGGIGFRVARTITP